MGLLFHKKMTYQSHPRSKDGQRQVRGMLTRVMISTFLLGCFCLSASLPALSAPAVKPAAVSAKPAASAASAAAKPDDGKPFKVATFGDWGTYNTQNGKNKICYAMSQPVTRAPDGLKRDPAFVFVSNRPNENVRGEVSIIMGFAVKATQSAPAAKGKPTGAQSFIEIGSTKLALIGKDSNAFLQNAAQESQLVDLMRKTPKMVIHMASVRGNETADSYSLNGFAQAYDRVKKECP